jgi:hypothetical protein
VNTYPHMLRAASSDYGFPKSDHLEDAIASLSSFFCSSGEIISPVLTGLMLTMLGFEMTSVIVGTGCLVYGFIYMITSGALKKRTAAIVPEASSIMSMVISHIE